MKTALFLVALLPMLACAQTASEIMTKVAENQSRAESARADYVYRQNVSVRLNRGNGKLAREEDREYSVIPEPGGIKREMVRFAGKYGVNGKEVAFSEPGAKYKDTDIDADLTRSLADDFGNDESSRDGINEDLFPLTAARQKNYVFTLTGRESWHDRKVFKIAFSPHDRKSGSDDGGAAWAGEALVDETDLTPVQITTHLARSVPLLVRTALGTDVQKLGFTVVYGRVADNLWFPVTYSGQLKLRALFLYERTISLKLVNSEFQKTDVNSTIVFEKTAADQ